jgi:membrane peptidoglycan carboxypeptidase
MQTSLARRQARRMNGRRRRGGGTGRKLAVAFPLFVFGSMALVALIGLVGVVGVFAAYSRDLPDPRGLEELVFIQESVVYDRTGQIELARFSSGERREAVEFQQIPPVLIDATTAIEDRSFWTNTGFDPVGILSAAVDTLRGRERGASTITQQLVRQRLLDEELVRDRNRVAERKIKEIIQSIRVTEAYPGEAGKQRIIAAYLNQNYYGNGSYGIKAAAKSYFGIDDLNQLSLGQVALLAALPQSPSSYDLVRNAVEDSQGNLYVPLDPDVPVVARRNYILDLLASDPSRRVLTGDTYTAADFEAAKEEPIRLVPQRRAAMRAPHFVWAVRAELAERLCSGEPTCPALERGGLRVTTTLDWDVQQIAEKWVTAAILLPHETDPEAAARELGVPYTEWMQNLRDKEVNNGALVAIDYQTGEVIAYVGSAGYYRSDIASPEFQPQFDVIGNGWRQPGSTFKVFNYATGIDERRMTAASMFMDVTTRFDDGTREGYIPKNADLLERGPVRLRSALQFSLNIPAVKALVVNGLDHVYEKAQAYGIRYREEQRRAGLSLTLGTEVVHPIDLTSGYGTIANSGRHVPHTRILRVTNAAGEDLVPAHAPPTGEPAITPQAAYIMTDILAGNTNPRQNPLWGRFNIRDGQDNRRPATLKTGTNNDSRDLMAVGYVAPPGENGRGNGQYALVVTSWAGNSDGSVVTTPDNPVFATDVAVPMWQGFLTEVTRTWPIRDFERPAGLVEQRVDAWSGMRPTQFSSETVNELFIDGTVPGEDTTKRGLQVITDAEGNSYLWTEGCPGTPETRGFLVLDDVERDRADWRAAIDDWIERAREGPGTAGGPDPNVETRTSYFYNSRITPYGKSWGAPFPPTQSCDAAPSPSPSPSPEPSPSPSLEPSPSPTEEPTPVPTEEPTPTPTQGPTPTPTPGPTPTPTPVAPTPTPTPTPEPPPDPPEEDQ